MSGSLDDVLVVTVRKSFWASPEAETFPHRVYAHVFYGHSTNLLNSLIVALRGLLAVWRRRPKLVVLGSVERVVPWFIRLRRYGLLGRARLLVTNQLHLDDEQLRQVDCVVLYARPLITSARPLLRERAAFLPLPADGDFVSARSAAQAGTHVFSGGGADRDFASVVEAVRGVAVALEIVTFTPEMVAESPENVVVHGPMSVQDYLIRMASSLFVVVPLRNPASQHGQTTVVQALALGKAVVATRSPGVVDYVEEEREGLLVEAGDVSGYRDAILRLASDVEFRARCERHALARGGELTYSAHREGLTRLYRELVDGRPLPQPVAGRRP